MRTGLIRYQAGFSLLEVLIGILVVSIGLLTVAGLQVVTKKANYDAVQRTTASLLVQEMAERMRNNAGSAGDDDTLASYLVPVGSPLGNGSIGAEPAPTCVSGAACAPAQLAAHDLWEWEQAIDGITEVIGGPATRTGGLVSPAACITGPLDGSDGIYTIAIAWRGTSPSANSTAASNCGLGSGNYGDDDEYRRVLIYSFFVNNPEI